MVTNGTKVAMIVMNPCVNDSRVIKEAESLTQAGYKVRVVCAQKDDVCSDSHINGVEYIRPDYRLPFGIRYQSNHQADEINKNSQKHFKFLAWLRDKLSAYVRFCITYATVKHAVTQWQPSVIHAHDLITLPAAIRLACQLKVPVIYDAHELEAHRMPVRRYFIKKIIYYLEKYYIRKAAGVITVSDSIAKYMVGTYKIKKPTLIYNSPICAQPTDFQPSLRKMMGVSDKTPLIVYVGGAQIGRGIEALLTAMQSLPAFHLALVGSRCERYYDYYRKMINDLNLSMRVRFLPIVPYASLLPYIAQADLGVCPIENTCLNHYYCMPNKLFEMAMAGLPVVVSDLPDMKKFVQENKLGLVLDDASAQSLRKTLEKAYLNRYRLKLTADQLKALIKEYGWQAQAQKLQVLYQEILCQFYQQRL